MKINIITRCLIIVGLLLSSSCGKEELKYSIPWALVDFQISYNQDPSLKTLGGFATFSKPRLASDRGVGFSGLLIVNGLDMTGNGNTVLHAYDLCCPKEGQRTIIVKSVDGITAKCDQCGSVFDIYNGTGRVISGSATETLQKYRVIPRDGSGNFRVIN